MTTMPKLTHARLRALEALAQKGTAVVSNRTSFTPGFMGAVYWQTADWLIAQGWAEHGVDGRVSRTIRITDAGRTAAKQLFGAADG